MSPTLSDGDRLAVRWGASPQVGQLVVVRLPDGPDGPRPVSVKRAAMRVHDGWWVERDNPDEGVDSWLVGAVADADVLGVVHLRLWPRPGRATRRPRR
ncbi:peptidase S24 [Angustibacter sp. McL0619]|uniref:peptidase S24 n=1 Tax=Angustibacter sp. McL0619 TaxID=3415676 RepID=UPI003CEDC96F